MDTAVEIACDEAYMTKAKFTRAVWMTIRNAEGQDLIEYALMAASFAVAVGAVFPETIAPNISTIFSKVVSSLNAS
jgi:Flp pilus assembly pilin Flp